MSESSYVQQAIIITVQMVIRLIFTTLKYDYQMGHGLRLECWKSTLKPNSHGGQFAIQISLEDLLT